MTKSTKWALFTFAVVATFSLGMLFARNGQPFGTAFSNASGDSNPQTQEGGKMLLLSPGSGNVGIGTTNPEEKSPLPDAIRDSGGIGSEGAGINAAAKRQLLDLGPDKSNTTGVSKPQAQAGNNLLLNPGGGNVGIGTFSPNEQLEITGNFRLPKTTATVGIIKSGGNRFIHNFGASNFFAGVNAGNLTMTGTGENTGVGVKVLQANTTGHSNTAVGDHALFSNTTGFNNTAFGSSALSSNTMGNNNTAAGHKALIINTTGTDNTATGGGALFSNTTGTDNTATGNEALFSNTTACCNTATGHIALNRNTLGGGNTATGVQALFSNTTGFSNTATGVDALLSNTIGNNNTGIGRSADVSANNLTNATVIGANAIVDASNKIRLGDSNVTVIEGQVAFTSVSDANLKENFLAIDGEETLDKISQISVGSWNYKGHDPSRFRHYGPTAQDFFAAFGDDGFGVVGTETTINSGDMAGIMMIAIQALEKRTAQVAKLEQLVGEQQEQMQRMEELLKAPEAMSVAKYNEN